MRVLALLFFLFANMSVVAEQQFSSVNLQSNQTVVQVNGIVCSFCAYGTEKNLSKLDFLDRTQFGDDGVLIDIQTHRIILAIQPGRETDVGKIYNAIKKGGYDPIAFYLSLNGKISKDGERFVLTSAESGQEFELIGHNRGLVEVKVDAIGLLDAALIPSIKSGQPIPVTILLDEV